MNDFGLTIAVPRGALLRRDARRARRTRASTPPRCAPTTASCSSRTSASSRCARPTSPTYVEAGAADIGITGKDVLMEQSERQVFELLDLGFGPCTHGPRLTRRPDDAAAEALRRLGVMRVATKYPRIAAEYLERTGPPGGDRRGQGLGRARAADRHGRGDRRPHGDRDDAARERSRDPRGDRDVHGAADRQPRVAARQGGGDRLARGARCVAELRRLAARTTPATRRRSRPELRAAVPGGATTSARRSPRSSRAVRDGGDAALAALAAEHDGLAAGDALRVDPERAGRRARGARPELRAALELAIENVGAVARAGIGEDVDRSRWLRARACGCARCPSERAAIYVPGGRAPYPSSVVMGVVTAREAGVERDRRLRSRRPPADPRRLRAVRRRGGLPRRRRTRDRGAGLRNARRSAAPT